MLIGQLIKPGDKVELTKKIDMVETDIFYSMIYDVEDELFLRIQAPLERGRIIPLELGVTYYVSVFTERGLIRGECELARRLKDQTLHIIEMKLLTPMKKYQRRQYYRMNCILTFNYEDVEEDESKKNSGTILDISGGGIRFSTRQRLNIGEMVICHLTLLFEDGEREIEVKGKVLQSKPIEPENGNYQNRIKFEDLDIATRETIIKFIFEEERRRRKKEKGM